MNLRQSLDSQEILASSWGLISAIAAIEISETEIVEVLPAAALAGTVFMGAYIIADEFIRRSKC